MCKFIISKKTQKYFLLFKFVAIEMNYYKIKFFINYN